MYISVAQIIQKKKKFSTTTPKNLSYIFEYTAKYAESSLFDFKFVLGEHQFDGSYDGQQPLADASFEYDVPTEDFAFKPVSDEKNNGIEIGRKSLVHTATATGETHIRNYQLY